MTTHSIGDDFDFGEAKKSIPDAQYAPDGIYTLKITKCEFKHSKGDPAKGKPSRPMFALTCSIISGPYAGLPVWHNLVYTEENPNAKRMFYGQLARLGIAQPGRGSEVASALVDRVFTAEVGHREYNGVISNQIEKFLDLQSTGAVGVPTMGVVPPAQAPIAPVQAPVVPEATVAPAPAPQLAPQPQAAPHVPF